MIIQYEHIPERRKREIQSKEFKQKALVLVQEI